MDANHSENEEVVGRFLTALDAGDTQGLMAALAPDVVLVADGGGPVPAARCPIEGMERVAGLLSKFSLVAAGAKIFTVQLNGAVAARIELNGDLATTVTFVFEKGQIARIYVISNPRKLARLGTEIQLTRE